MGVLPGTTPPRVRRLLERCLAQDPKHRVRDIGDARFELDDALGSPDAPLPTTTGAPAKAPRWRDGSQLPQGWRSVGRCRVDAHAAAGSVPHLVGFAARRGSAPAVPLAVDAAQIAVSPMAARSPM